MDYIPSVGSGTVQVLQMQVPTAVVAAVSALVAVGVAATVLACLDAWLKTKPATVHYEETPFNEAVLSKCTSLSQPYAPMPFLTNGHVETIFAAKFRAKSSDILFRRECLVMDDNGCVALDWEHFDANSKLPDLPSTAPVVILFPGLTGGSGDSYVQYAVRNAYQRGLRAVVFNSRGTADSPVTTPQFYSASFTGDTRAVIAHVQQCYPDSPLVAAGWSLGANILVRYLGEQGSDTPLLAAVSMCNPFNLTVSNQALKSGFSRIYDRNLANALRCIFNKHSMLFVGAERFSGVRPDKVATAQTIDDFDEAITRHSFGWDSVEQYYANSGSCYSVPKVKIPLFCLQALDDPIAPRQAIPYDALAANPHCVLVTTETGGHLGWVSGPGGLFGRPWSCDVSMEWLQHALDVIGTQPQNGRPASLTPSSTPAPSTSGAPGASSTGDLVSVGGNGGGGNGHRTQSLPLTAASLLAVQLDSEDPSSSRSSHPRSAPVGGDGGIDGTNAASTSPQVLGAARPAGLSLPHNLSSTSLCTTIPEEGAAPDTPAVAAAAAAAAAAGVVGPSTAPGMVLSEQAPMAARGIGSRPPRSGASSPPPARMRSVSPVLRGSRASSPDRWAETQFDNVRFG